MDQQFVSDLVYTDVFYKVDDREYAVSKYLTTGQLKLIKDIGYITIDHYKCQIKEIILSWDSKTSDLIAIIETTVIKR